MKTPSKKRTITKKAVAKTKKVTPEKAPEQKDKYLLVANMNAGVYMSSGNDMTVFSKLEKPSKYTTKAVLTLTNLDTGKSFEAVFQPYLMRKLQVNPIVQSIQWDRMAGKVDLV